MNGAENPKPTVAIHWFDCSEDEDGSRASVDVRARLGVSWVNGNSHHEDLLAQQDLQQPPQAKPGPLTSDAS